MDFLIILLVVGVIYYGRQLRTCVLATRGVEKYEREHILNDLVDIGYASAIIANRFRWRTVF